MAKCKNCGMELGPEETCVFATYRLDMNGKELMICCERCAANMNAPQQPAAPPVLLAPPALSVKRTPMNTPARKRKAPRKAPRKATKKAPRKAPGKAPRKAVRKAAAKKGRKAAKKTARRPKRKPAARRRRR